MRIDYGVHSSMVIHPADTGGFLSDMAARCPHLSRRGRQLVCKDVQVAYSFSSSRPMGREFSR